MAKKKILLLSDDLRMHSGIATQSKTIVMNTLHHYDWAQIAGAIKHPDKGKVMDMRESLEKDMGYKDIYLRLYPVDGYGNAEVLREVMQLEKPDAILHYTDPRFWGWLYQMEHELRREIPIFYYNIWDDLPYPRWNEPFYESCDLIMNISKQTHNIVDKVCRTTPRTDWDSTYVPHGIETKTFHPIDKKDKKLLKFSESVFQGHDYDFVVFWNNRNIKRKLPADVILAYKYFCDMLPIGEASKCALIMHTAPKDPNGTDLPAVVEELCPNYDIIFSHQGLSDMELCYLYNLSDVTINMASNEGFGLGTCESLHCGTPISVNVTGGLQDQCGFKKEDGSLLTKDDYVTEWGSNHDGRYQECGEWAFPVFPSNRSLQGSIPTPYIFDDRPRWEDVAVKIREWYDTPKKERVEAGLKGREWMLTEEVSLSATDMCRLFMEHMDTAFEKWKPRKRFTIYKA